MKACTFCLQTNVKVNQLGCSDAVNFIQQIFLNNGFPEVSQHNYICYLCNYQLNKSYDFIQKTLRAQKAIKDILERGNKVTVATLRTIDRVALRLDTNLICQETEIHELWDNNNSQIKQQGGLRQPDEKRPPGEEIEEDKLIAELCNVKTENDYIKETVLTPSEYIFRSDHHRDDYDEQYVENPIDIVKTEMLHDLVVKIDVEPFEEPATESYFTEFKIEKKTKKVKNFKRKPKEEIDSVVPQPKPPQPKPKRKQIKKKGKRGRKKVKEILDTRVYPMGCEICKYEISNKTEHFHHYLLYHRGVKYPHSRDQKFICQHCGISKSTGHVLRQHEKTHGEKKVECQDCGKLFHNETRLKIHRKRHGTSLMYCDYCNKGFVAREDIVLHIRTHTGVKPFKCKICDAAFAHRGNVTIHMRSRHQQTSEPGRPPPAKKRRTQKQMPELIGWTTK